MIPQMQKLLAVLAPIGFLMLACAHTTLVDASSASKIADRWNSLSLARKYAFMVDVVTPRMRKLFLDFDPHRYPRMSCTPCHKRNSRPGDFQMPNPDLLLDAACSLALSEIYPSSSVPNQHHHSKQLSAMDDFMLNRVTPEMAQLLGKVPYTQTTKSGYGCFGCHIQER